MSESEDKVDKSIEEIKESNKELKTTLEKTVAD